jgi:flagellar protein FlaG
MIHDVIGKAELQVAAQYGTGSAAGSTRASADRTGSHEPVSDPFDRDALERAAAKVLDVFQEAEPRVRIEIDPELERVVVKIVKGDTNEVIRQIPPQELLDLAKRLTAPKGFLLKEEA